MTSRSVVIAMQHGSALGERRDYRAESTHHDQEPGLAALDRALAEQRRRGRSVTPNGSRTLFTIKDKNGVVVQESEIVPSA